MNKIIITIDEFGWKKELTLNGQTYTEEHKRTPYGSTGKSVFEDIEEIPEELYDAISSINEYDTMKAFTKLSIRDFEND